MMFRLDPGSYRLKLFQQELFGGGNFGRILYNHDFSANDFVDDLFNLGGDLGGHVLQRELQRYTGVEP